MPAWICVTCGVQYPDTDRPPGGCPICEDERQYVGWHGQQWTTMAEIADSHTVVLRNEEADLVGIGVEPSFAIGQRALLVRTAHGNVLWDCVSLLDEQTRGQIADLGGIAAICLSHPHFYAANVEFADAFDARIFIPRADQPWIQRPSPRIELFDNDIEPARPHPSPHRRTSPRRVRLSQSFRDIRSISSGCDLATTPVPWACARSVGCRISCLSTGWCSVFGWCRAGG
jgi:hypothetical protein